MSDTPPAPDAALREKLASAVKWAREKIKAAETDHPWGRIFTTTDARNLAILAGLSRDAGADGWLPIDYSKSLSGEAPFTPKGCLVHAYGVVGEAWFHVNEDNPQLSAFWWAGWHPDNKQPNECLPDCWQPLPSAPTEE